MLRGAPTLTPDTEALFEKALATLKAAGATLVVDGRDIDVDGDAGGFWLLPRRRP